VPIQIFTEDHLHHHTTLEINGGATSTLIPTVLDEVAHIENLHEIAVDTMTMMTTQIATLSEIVMIENVLDCTLQTTNEDIDPTMAVVVEVMAVGEEMIETITIDETAIEMTDEAVAAVLVLALATTLTATTDMIVETDMIVPTDIMIDETAMAAERAVEMVEMAEMEVATMTMIETVDVVAEEEVATADGREMPKNCSLHMLFLSLKRKVPNMPENGFQNEAVVVPSLLLL
jgi:hypothetical protein